MLNNREKSSNIINFPRATDPKTEESQRLANSEPEAPKAEPGNVDLVQGDQGQEEPENNEDEEISPQSRHEKEIELLLKNFAESTLTQIRLEALSIWDNQRKFLDGNVGTPDKATPSYEQVRKNSAEKNAELAQLTQHLKSHFDYAIAFLHKHFPDLGIEPTGKDRLKWQANIYLTLLTKLDLNLAKAGQERLRIVEMAQLIARELEPHTKINFGKLS